MNGEAQIHARVDGKKVVISKASIRRDLYFANKEGVDCLPNSTIFEQLALMGMGRNSDNLSRKLMYPWFIQVFLDKQIDGLSNQERKYVSSSHTKKSFRNMRRIRKGFSGRITPLFPTMVVQSQLGEGSSMPNDPHITPTILKPLTSQPQKTHKPRKPTKKVTQVPHPCDPIEHVADEGVHKELGDNLLRAVTTTFSLEAEQDNGAKKPWGIPLPKLEKTKTTQANESDSLKSRVKKLKRRNMSRTYKLKRLYKVGLTARVEFLDNKESLGKDASKHERIKAINADEDITLVNVQADAKMFDANKDLGGEEVFAEEEVVVDKEKIDEVALVQALAELKTSKPKTKGVVIQDLKHVRPKKKDQIMLDEEANLKLQAKFDEEQRLAREKAKKELKANISLTETWDDVQEKIDADHQLTERLQAKEQQELIDEEKATLFMQFLEKRRKFFTAKRAEEKRNKLPTQAQKRKIMCTYLKNMEGYTFKQLSKVQEMFDKAFKRVNTFEDFRT
nr:hypothetical protein [Tanacetum cinerariifolium]